MPFPNDDITVNFSPIFGLRDAFLYGKARIHDYTTQIMSELARDVAVTLREHTPHASGDLADSTWWGVVTPPELVIALIGQSARGLSGEPYSHFVARGTGPARVPASSPYHPPSSALRSWVRIKFGVSGATQIHKAAFALSMSIHRKGTKPNPYPKRAIEASNGRIRQATNELGRAITITLTDFEDTGTVD